jgi:hypothetical protein
MSMNDVISMLMDVPPMLAGGWGAWFFVGLLLSIWSRREQMQPAATYASFKHKSGVRAAAVSKPSSGARAPRVVEAAPPSEDAFADLERLLEPQKTHHIPGDDRPAPMIAEAPALASPQSLP